MCEASSERLAKQRFPFLPCILFFKVDFDMWNNGLRLTTFLLACCFFSAGSQASDGGESTPIDLTGSWKVRLDPSDIGEQEKWFGEVAGTPIELPGITGEAGLGEALILEPALTKEVFHHLHQRHKFVGAAWYAREFQLDDERVNSSLSLMLERVIWETKVWINGQLVGSKNSLTTPHRYDVGPLLRPGQNRIVIRVDNRPSVDIGNLGHAYTDETQTIWNGVIGKIQLEHPVPIQIKNYPLRVKVSGAGTLMVRVEPLQSDAPSVPEWSVDLTEAQTAGGEISIDVPMDQIVRWSEFDPALYRVTCQWNEQQSSLVTGFRDVATDGQKLLINGNPSFMRGTLECCIFPKTGYPPMDAEGWDKVMGTLKEYGLNHLRFHSWCPPEAAFESADRHGIYVQAELPNWTFKMGELPETDQFLIKEGERILREYAHHPSFVFFSMGNELTGDYSFLDKMVEGFHKDAPHLLYTSTSYSFSQRGLKPGPNDDFFITQRTSTDWVRGQGFLNQTWPTTDSDYQKGLGSLPVPLITHEVGQYNVYPNLAELPKYDGNLRALNYEAIQQDLQSKGRLDQADDYTLNSGKLAVALYKEDIERALRTKNLSGIQLLDLHDFPGQSTATVGLLDAFWDSKGLVSPEEFRRFCAPVVPLLRMGKMAWSQGEQFQANVEIANFSSQPIKDAVIQWEIKSDSGQTVASGALQASEIAIGNGIAVGEISVPIDSNQGAAKWTVSVAIKDTDWQNQWNVWVYPKPSLAKSGSDEADGVVVIRQFGKPLFDALASGNRVLFLPQREEIREPLDGRFIPVFWSPLHFPNQPGSLGTMIDAGHPVFSQFPTSTHTDWQWWELLATSTSVSGAGLGPKFQPIMQFVDKFNRNDLPAILWEAKVGPGSLFVCSLDIDSDPEKRIVAAQLKSSILNYVGSDEFDPGLTVPPSKLIDLFQSRPYRIKLAAGTTHPSYPITHLDDGDAKTIWHSDWRDTASQHPYHLVIEMLQPMTVSGLTFQGRSGNPNGNVDQYQISTSVDGENWSVVKQGRKPSASISFDQPVSVSHVRFEALSEVNRQQHCAIAELKPIFESGTTSVDELGLIEGFNTEAKD